MCQLLSGDAVAINKNSHKVCKPDLRGLPFPSVALVHVTCQLKGSCALVSFAQSPPFGTRCPLGGGQKGALAGWGRCHMAPILLA